MMIQFGGAAAKPNPLVFEKADWEGPSYIFTKEFAADEVQVDSVRWFNQQIRLWEEALKLNEEQKVNAADGFAGIPNTQANGSGVLKNQEVTKMNDRLNGISLNNQGNISFSAGSPVSSSATLSNSLSWQFAWEVNLDNVTATNIGVKVNGIGVENNNSFTVGMTQSESKSAGATQTNTFNFTLQDDDDGDFFTVDIFDGGNQNGPIFKTRGGQSSCPYEGEITTQYHEPGTLIQAASVIRDQPGIGITPAKLVNVPSDEFGVFTLNLKNDNTNEARTYRLQVDESSNPFGAIIKIDGLDPNRAFNVPAGSSVIKTVTVERGPEAYDYENLRLILSSDCDENIQVFETFSAKFLPTCSTVNLMSPLNQWVVNKSFNDTLQVYFNDYDINFASLKKIMLQYKPSNSATWVRQAEFFNKESAEGDTLLISRSNPYTAYNWNIKNLLDGEYDLRVVSVCENEVQRFSAIHSGIIDRVSPHNFGAPSPADGVLLPNDEIGIRFNETINEGLINKGKDLDIRGVLNGSDIRHFTSVFFDGDDRMTIPAINLSGRSFSIEFWMKRGSLQEGILFQQGSELIIGLNDAGRLYANIGGQEFTSSASITDQEWHHIALTYNKEGQMNWYIDASSDANATVSGVLTQTSAPIIVGSSYQGNMHDLRIWNSVRSLTDIRTKYLKTLNPRQSSLIGYWPMDKGRGNVVVDLKERRPATLEATWSFAQETYALSFDGVDDYFKVNTSTMIFDEETDFTISFWFKGNNGVNVTLLSNGPIEDDIEINRGAWAIQTDEHGIIFVKNSGAADFPVGTKNYFDGQWHHLALVINRFGTSKVYVDAALIATANSDQFGPLASAEMYLGAYGRNINNAETIDQHFTGSIDEFRIWKSVRKQAQIDRDRYFNLKGDEFGLRGYFPFEAYMADGGGLEILQANREDQTDSLDITYDELVAFNAGTVLHSETPPVKMYRPVEKVNFSYAINEDHIILTPAEEDAAKIENVTLDITVKNLQDQYGNPMESPVSWIAYVDRNQVIWIEDTYTTRIVQGQVYSFTAAIENNGGNNQSFSIENLPEWLEASPENGTIAPQETQKISFLIKETLAIGNYQEDIGLLSDMGFEELLNVQVEVYAEGPDWKVDPSEFDFSMSIVGAIEIGGVLSTDTNDKLAAFIDGELRGMADLQYLAASDAYRVFMDIYSDSEDAQTISFQIWDASEGIILEDVSPNLVFANGTGEGSPRNPVVFSAQELQLSTIELEEGWNWISVNVLPRDSEVSHVLANLDATENDIFRNQDFEDVYTETGWEGDLTDNGGVEIKEGFRLKVDKAQTLTLTGTTIDLSNTEIIVEAGQNWIPYLENRVMTLNQALVTLEPSEGDRISGQEGFSIYDPVAGWIGSLISLRPGASYLLTSSKKDTLIYPQNRVFGRSANRVEPLDKLAGWDLPKSEVPSNMSITVNVETDLNLEDQLLFSYNENKEIIGVGTWIQNAFYLTAYGKQNGQKISFEMMDSKTGAIQVFEKKQAFQGDGFAHLNFSMPITKEVLPETPSVSEVEAKVYPNPSSGPFTIDYTAPTAGHLTIKMQDATGKTVAKIYEGEVVVGSNKLDYTMPSSLMNGVYLLVLEQDNTRKILRMVKQ